MFNLLIMMLERLGIIVMIAFLLTRFRFFRSMLSSNALSPAQQYKAILFFGLFGIIGTYTGLIFNLDTFEIERWKIGIEPDEAISNFRVIGIVLAGLLGGYKIGIGAGLIAGIHRYLLGGYTALSCGIAPIIAGIFAGYFHKKDRHISLKKVFTIAATAEIIQMALIVLLSRPLDKVLDLIQFIGLPMVLANGLGGALFMLIIQVVIKEEEKVGASQAQLTLRIADQTISHLRKGLNYDTALAACSILYKETNAIAVAMTNEREILAHVGQGDDHHKQASSIQTQVTRNTIHTGSIIIASGDTIHCDHKGCSLKAVVVAPLKQHGETIGTLKFYFKSEKEINTLVKELIAGLAELLSNQLEIAKADEALKLARESEINALQAQIQPHFLFNTLNTITSLIRIDPMKARKLLVSLSHFIRQNLTVTTDNAVTIDQELKHVSAYLDIEQTRFQDRLQIDYDIDESALQSKIPPLTLQPIVENAMKHGLKNKKSDCRIWIQIKRIDENIVIAIKDNGVGMNKKLAETIGRKMVPSTTGTGMALYNVNRRLNIMFGQHIIFQIDSEKDKGTSIHFQIPVENRGVTHAI